MDWTFVTNHGRVLLAVAVDPTRTIRQIAAEVGITERAVHRIIVALTNAGYLERIRVGRRVHNRVNVHQIHVESLERAATVRQLFALLAATTPVAQHRDEDSEVVA
jgi:DNA-binding Lrp family transcriptional regulator